MNDSADQEHVTTSARALAQYRLRRARSRERVRFVLDAMAAEARRHLGEAFIDNDPLTGRAVALVVRSDERLPDDYETLTPRPPTDTVSRLIVEVLGRALTIEINDAGAVRATGDTSNVSLNGVTDVRVADTAANAPTYLVIGNDEKKPHSEIPFVRALADLIDTAVRTEADFNISGAEATTPPPVEPNETPESSVPETGAAL